MIYLDEQADGRWLLVRHVSEQEAAARGIAPGEYQEGWIAPQSIVGRMNGGRAKEAIRLVQIVIDGMRAKGLEVTVRAIKR